MYLNDPTDWSYLEVFHVLVSTSFLSNGSFAAAVREDSDPAQNKELHLGHSSAERRPCCVWSEPYRILSPFFSLDLLLSLFGTVLLILYIIIYFRFLRLSACRWYENWNLFLSQLDSTFRHGKRSEKTHGAVVWITDRIRQQLIDMRVVRSWDTLVIAWREALKTPRWVTRLIFYSIFRYRVWWEYIDQVFFVRSFIPVSELL